MNELHHCAQTRIGWRPTFIVSCVAAFLAVGALITRAGSDAIGDWAFERLTHRFPIVEAPLSPKPTGIIIVGGTFNGSSNPGERFLAGIRLARQFGNAKVAVIGAGSFPEGEGPEDALFLAGIDVQRVVVEKRSTNTYENAVYAAELLAPAPRDSWILITSACHMPRAAGAFRKAGFQFEAYPVDDGPVAAGMHAQTAFREIIGLLFYGLTGRSAALFPGP